LRHLGNFFNKGIIVFRDDIFVAEPDSFIIRIVGRGSHGAYPHKSVDPVLIASQIVVSLQRIVSREIDPIDSVVVTYAASYRFDLVVWLSNEYK
jgi:metal-dependent amidase/aminoacylase/carboxypeptidase family protein